MLTAYDCGFARIFDEAGIDVLLVGDSLANVVQGLDKAPVQGRGQFTAQQEAGGSLQVVEPDSARLVHEEAHDLTLARLTGPAGWQARVHGRHGRRP